jgi:demethylspheroidene O-methyltransferase
MSLLTQLQIRLVGDRRFQRWAARFWLTRPVARRNTRALFDLCAGFIYAQVLLACVQLRLFDLLAALPLTVGEVAAATGMELSAAACLLESAAALGLLARRGDGFGLGMLGAAVRGNPGVLAMIRHHPLLYDDLRDPVAMLRAPGGMTRLKAYWAYAESAAPAALRGESVDAYTALMAASQPMISDEVLAAYDFRRHACLLDVGGGDGSFLAAVARATPAMRLMLFDLPAVAEAAQARLDGAGLRDRAVCVGGDFQDDALPDGADLISFVRVLHDHDDASVRRLLLAAHAALPPGGRLLIAEPMADDPSVAAYFNVYLRAMGSGRPRRAAELQAMAAAAGFRRPRLVATPTPLLVRVMIADVNPG